jgi:hypothetical protein
MAASLSEREPELDQRPLVSRRVDLRPTAGGPDALRDVVQTDGPGPREERHGVGVADVVLLDPHPEASVALAQLDAHGVGSVVPSEVAEGFMHQAMRDEPVLSARLEAERVVQANCGPRPGAQVLERVVDRGSEAQVAWIRGAQFEDQVLEAVDRLPDNLFKSPEDHLIDWLPQPPPELLQPERRGRDVLYALVMELQSDALSRKVLCSYECSHVALARTGLVRRGVSIDRLPVGRHSRPADGHE